MYAVSLYTAAMRAALLLALVAACGFEVTGGNAGQPGDGGADGRTDAPPDSFVALPACMTSAAYANGPEAGHRYRKTASLDRDAAVDACTADGAHLAVVTDATEDAHVRSVAGGSDFWIGLDDLKTEGALRWVTGAPYAYERFEGAEPNDNGAEDCVMVNGDGTWNDTSCGDSRPAVCECEAAFTPKPTPVCRGMAGATHAGRKYILRKGAGRTWNAAKADCESIGAHLPVFADREEEGPVNSDFLGDNWLGLTDLATEGTFVWLDGTTPPDASIHWNLGSPHANNTSRNCVRINLEWQDDTCTSDTHEYACECEP